MPGRGPFLRVRVALDRHQLQRLDDGGRAFALAARHDIPIGGEALALRAENGHVGERDRILRW